MRRKTYLVAPLLIVSFLVIPILGLQGSQSISSHGTVSYPATKPIFLVFPPIFSPTATDETTIGNVISATQDLSKYFDVSYYIRYHLWKGNLSKLEEIISTYEKYSAKVAVLIIHGYGTPDHLDGMMLLTPQQIAKLKQNHDNFVGMVVAEYLTRYPNNSTIVSRLETVLRAGRDNDLWVAVENEWWGWRWRDTLNFTVIDPLVKEYNKTIIVVSKTNGASLQPWSWGVCMGYMVAYETRWGISDEAWYWKEVTGISGSETECPIDVIINSAFYTLIHNAMYITFEPPWYFFNDDGTARETLVKFKKALMIYFENDVPKTKMNKIAVLNLPFELDGPDSFGYESHSSYVGKHYNSPCESMFNMTYGFKYDPEGLINIKVIFPVLPYPTPTDVLRKFDFFIIADIPYPNGYGGNVSDYTYIDNNRTEEIYNYILNISSFADVFITDAIIFTSNCTQVNWVYYITLGCNLTDLTGLKPPYSVTNEISTGIKQLVWNHTGYEKTETINITRSGRLYTGTTTENCDVIATLDGKPFIYQYINAYGHKVYTKFVEPPTKVTYDTRYKVGAFIDNVTSKLIYNIETYSGVLLYHIEYNVSKSDLADRDSITYVVNTTGNYVLHAPFTFNDGKYRVTLSPDHSYGIVKEDSIFGSLRLTNSSHPITFTSYADHQLIVEMEGLSESIGMIKVYCADLGKPYKVFINGDEKPEESVWWYNSSTRVLTVNVEFTDEITVILDWNL